MSCPPSERLAAWAEGGIPTPALTHVAACQDCRRDLAASRRALGSEALAPRRRRWWIPLGAAAAAGLLILLRAPERPGTGPTAPTPPVETSPSPFPTASPDGLLEATRERSEPFGTSGLLTLAPGARAQVIPGETYRIRLLGGALALETRGSPALIEAGETRIQVEDGEVVVEAVPPRQTAWITSAEAASSAVSVAVLRGSAQVGDILLREGQRTGPIAWRPDGAWRRPSGLPARLSDGSLALGDIPAGRDFVWETLIRRGSEEASVAVVWRAGEDAWRLPLGHGTMGRAGPWVRLRIERRASWVRIQVAGREALCCAETDLFRKAYPSAPLKGYPGIVAWSGEIEVPEARWKELP